MANTKKANTKKAKKKKSIKAKPKVKSAAAPIITPHPTAGSKVTDFENELDQQIAAGKSDQPKRGPGRPPKEPGPAQPADLDQGPELTTKVIDRILRIPFSVWASTIKIEEIKLLDREAADLAAATKELLDYYVPNLPVHIIIWSNFSVAALAIFGPRLVKIQELKKARAAQQTTDGSQPGQGGPAAPVVETINKPQGKPDFPSVDDIKKTTTN